MQEDARRAMTDHTKSASGPDAASSSQCLDDTSADAPLVPLSQARPLPSFPYFHLRSQTKGWAVKALEFINSGPPALLNNPCCSRRVVISPFLKHAMEVHYG